MVDAYLAGEKIESIAAEFGVYKTVPGNLAVLRGFPRRKPRAVVTTSSRQPEEAPRHAKSVTREARAAGVAPGPRGSLVTGRNGMNCE